MDPHALPGGESERRGWEGSCGCLPAGLNQVALGICRDAIFGGKKEQFLLLRKERVEEPQMATAGWLASGDPLSPVLGLAIIHMAFLPLTPKKNLPSVSTFVSSSPALKVTLVCLNLMWNYSFNSNILQQEQLYIPLVKIKRLVENHSSIGSLCCTSPNNQLIFVGRTLHFS